MIESVRYASADNDAVIVVIDGIEWHNVLLDVDAEIPNKVRAWIAAGNAPDLYVAPANPVPQIISDRQFFQQLAVLGVITQEEAEEAAGPGTIPAQMLPSIEALPEEQQFPARMMLRSATTYERTHPMTLALAQAYGWGDAELDALWSAAAAL